MNHRREATPFNADQNARFPTTAGNSGLPRMDNNDNAYRAYQESKDAKIISMMNKILESQSAIMERLYKMEKNIEDLQAVQKKTSADLLRIDHRMGAVKDLTTHIAAHSLNTSRKVHGAPSVLDPVKQFKEGGFKDWSIRPALKTSVASPPANPWPAPMIPPINSAPMPPMPPFPFPPAGVPIKSFGFSKNAHQDRSRTPGFAPKTPVDHEEISFTLQSKVAPPPGNPWPAQMIPPLPPFTFPPPGYPINQFGIYRTSTKQQDRSRTPGVAPSTPIDHEDVGYSCGTRTPAYGTRTPVYEDEASQQDFRSSVHHSNFPGTSSSSSQFGHNRYEPYKNKNYQSQSNTNPARRTSSPYIPTSPQYCD